VYLHNAQYEPFAHALSAIFVLLNQLYFVTKPYQLQKYNKTNDELGIACSTHVAKIN
jgi:hypothetical protein